MYIYAGTGGNVEKLAAFKIFFLIGNVELLILNDHIKNKDLCNLLTQNLEEFLHREVNSDIQ